jgi:hypothetical protein
VSAQDIKAVVTSLSTARDDLRREYSRATTAASDEQRFDSLVAEAMTAFGNASSFLSCLLGPAKAHFLRVSTTPHCPSCGTARRNQTSLAELPVSVPISTDAIRRGKRAVTHTQHNHRDAYMRRTS